MKPLRNVYQVRIGSKIKEEVERVFGRKCKDDHEGEEVFECHGRKRGAKGFCRSKKLGIGQEALASNLPKDTSLTDCLQEDELVDQ